VFDSEAMIVGEGWKTYALCVGIFGFYFIFMFIKFTFSFLFSSWHITVGGMKSLGIAGYVLIKVHQTLMRGRNFA